MTRDAMIKERLTKEGCSPIVFAESHNVVYIPTGFCERHLELLEELKLKRREDDTLLCPARSLNTGKALWGYDI